jgi:dTDP-4-amino-4,6-dideoxygalactose transaminase
MLAEDVRQIPLVNLSAQFAEERDDLMPLIEAALQRGDYVGGDAVQDLERDLQDMLHVRHALALNSGTDALIFALIALGIGEGHEVITPPNSFIASTSAIIHAGARPVFVDVGPDQNLDPHLIAQAITPRTRAIMPVHLTGRICEMDPIAKIAKEYGLAIVEDAAQSIGSRYRGRFSGALGDIGCFSLHPLKNLNAAGDGGFLTTDDDAIADRVRRLRNHGMQDRDTVMEFGYVSRLDTIQAVLLRYRLGRLENIISMRRRNAEVYRAELDRRPVFIPDERDDAFDTYHTFVVQVDRRDELKTHLAARGVATAIHYPNPIHLQPASKELGYRRGDFPVAEAQAGRILTLPINPFLSPDDIRYVADQVNGFFSRRGA